MKPKNSKVNVEQENGQLYCHSDEPRQQFGHRGRSTTNYMVCFAGDHSYTSQSRSEIPKMPTFWADPVVIFEYDHCSGPAAGWSGTT